MTGLSNEKDMEKAGVLNFDGPIDAWLTKGGKSLKSIVSEITDLQSRLDWSLSAAPTTEVVKDLQKLAIA